MYNHPRHVQLTEGSKKVPVPQRQPRDAKLRKASGSTEGFELTTWN